MTNSFLGDHQAAVFDVDESVLDGYGMSRNYLNAFLVKLGIKHV